MTSNWPSDQDIEKVVAIYSGLVNEFQRLSISYQLSKGDNKKTEFYTLGFVLLATLGVSWFYIY